MKKKSSPLDRRKFLKQGGVMAIGGAAMLALGKSAFAENVTSHTSSNPVYFVEGDDKFILPVLPYTYDALEPFIDKMTMEIHYSKHHQAYVNNLNKALVGTPVVAPDDLLKKVSSYPLAVRNNAGGHYNHSLYWSIMKPNGGGQASGPLLAAIQSAFGSFDVFKEKFTTAATSVFGSGWVWLVINQSGVLEIGSTPNQDNPLMDISTLKGFPLMGLDVWEHAYYLKHQNKRIDYVKDWWNILNWEAIQKRFSEK